MLALAIAALGTSVLAVLSVRVRREIPQTRTAFDRLGRELQPALVELQKLGVWGHELPVLPFHTPLAADFAKKLKEMMAEMPVNAPVIPVYCGMNGRPHPSDPARIRERVIVDSLFRAAPAAVGVTPEPVYWGSACP